MIITTICLMGPMRTTRNMKRCDDSKKTIMGSKSCMGSMNCIQRKQFRGCVLSRRGMLRIYASHFFLSIFSRSP